MLREAKFLAVASETIHGLGKRASERVFNDKPRTFVGQHSQDKSEIEFKTYPCLKCEQNHPLWKCPKFQALTVQDRWKSVTQSNLCYCCQGKNHVLQNCREARSCGINGCQKLHNRFLHKAAERPKAND